MERRNALTPELSLALIGNASGADFWGGAGSRIEAFSIRRLGGSRWRLRRTRYAMGFERQRGSEQRLGKAARRGGKVVRIVGMVLKMSESVCGKWPERRSARRRAHECAGVREHIPGPAVVDTLRRIEVSAWG